MTQELLGKRILILSLTHSLIHSANIYCVCTMGWARFQALGNLPDKADKFPAYTQVKTSPENIRPVLTTCQALHLALRL